MWKKYFLIFGLVIFIFSFSNFCFARELEVDYPPLPTGESLGKTALLPQYVKYMFGLGMFIGFSTAILSLIIGGVLYITSVANPGARGEAKSRIFAAIYGTVLLATIYLIMTTINPQLSILKIASLEKIPDPPPLPPPAGVRFYTEAGCPSSSDEDKMVHRLSIPDFGELKNNIRSVKITHDNLYYVAVLYDVRGYRGKCLYINPNTSCNSVAPFAASASIYKYAHSPSGNGVTFYRKSFYNSEGGWYKIRNNEIGGIYVGNLKYLEFEDVPEEEQDCIEWDLDGACITKKSPTLEGENISSIRIDGNYFVMLLYLDPVNDSPTGPWTFCQAFPTEDDMNKQGPRQIKWEYIRRQGKAPNYVLIFPVKEK